MRTLDGKVVVITGAGSGMGRALAIQSAAMGAELALSDWDEVGLVETLRLVSAQPNRGVRTDKLDVRDRAAMREYAASVAAELGRVNVLINNAGVALSGDFTDTSYDDFEWVMDVNFWGVVQGTKEFLPHLIASGDGHLVNISSLFGLIGIPGQTAYNAAKFGVRGFTEGLRQEMLIERHPVQVTCVHPGGIKTAIARNGRATTPEEQVALADFFDRRLATMSAERAAEIILAGVLANKPRVVFGNDARALDLLARVTGSRYQRIVATAAKRVRARTSRR